MKLLKAFSLVITALCASGIVSVHAQSTAFTYQGRLRDNNIPATGVFDLRFVLYDAAIGDNQVGSDSEHTVDNVQLNNGLFSVLLDFGSDAFTGGERWLEISLRPGSETGGYTTLDPRRQLTPTPYSLHAYHAATATTANSMSAENLTGTIPLSVLPGEVVLNNETGLTLSGTFSGSGAGLTSVNADMLDDKDGAFYQNAANLTDGTLDDARLSANVALLDSDQIFTGAKTFAGDSLFEGVAQMTNTENLLVGTHAGDGSGLSNLTATSLIGIAPKAADFTGTLAGDVTGTQGSTVVLSVGGLTAAEIASGANLANSANVAATGDTLVKRDGAGGFSAGTINAKSFEGSGSLLAALDADELTMGTVSDERLSGNANSVFQAVKDATYENKPNTLVKRDSTGSFVAENISVTGKFSGDGSGLVNIPASSIVDGGGGSVSLPSGIMLVSTLPNDTSLVENGCKLMMTVPAPPWVTSAAVGSASARFGHSAVWDGQRLIIWGGRPVVGSIYLNTGASYRPDTDQWEAVSTVDAPSARWGHTAVWSGSQMLVWGGNGDSGALNTGGRFQPDRQLWRPISGTDSPSARTEHVAVWTGTQMLIWGGQNASGLRDDGGLYSPGTDQWSGVVAQDAPTARVGATAVWAEDRVLIWGGEGGGGALNSGSQLLFEDGTTRWVAMTLPEAFAPRRGHSAIWTGSKMIIWGGQSGGVPFGDGAAYDPGTDSWELFSVGAPAARFNHAAVWTGQEMLILGGSNGSGELASGAAYDPATATWRPLSNAGSPRGRTEATAAWTGTEVLVFGGRAQGVAVGSLQRLVPQPVWYFYRKL